MLPIIIPYHNNAAHTYHEMKQPIIITVLQKSVYRHHYMQHVKYWVNNWYKSYTLIYTQNNSGNTRSTSSGTLIMRWDEQYLYDIQFLWYSTASRHIKKCQNPEKILSVIIRQTICIVIIINNDLITEIMLIIII